MAQFASVLDACNAIAYKLGGMSQYSSVLDALDAIYDLLAGGGAAPSWLSNSQSYEPIIGPYEVQIDNGSGTLYINPPALIANCLVHLPLSPVKNQVCKLIFGGAGNVTTGLVVTALTIDAPGVGQSIQGFVDSEGIVESPFAFQYNEDNKVWYVITYIGSVITT